MANRRLSTCQPRTCLWGMNDDRVVSPVIVSFLSFGEWTPYPTNVLFQDRMSAGMQRSESARRYLRQLRASFASDRASRQQMLDLAQAALSIGIELAGRCDGCLEQVGESATRRGIRGQQLRQRLNCGAFVHGPGSPTARAQQP